MVMVVFWWLQVIMSAYGVKTVVFWGLQVVMGGLGWSLSGYFDRAELL